MHSIIFSAGQYDERTWPGLEFLEDHSDISVHRSILYDFHGTMNNIWLFCCLLSPLLQFVVDWVCFRLISSAYDSMIRQTLVDERVSALHHHTLQSPGDSDGEMSKLTPRRVPPPIASRIVIKKNASLLPTADETTLAAPVPPVPTVDPRSRVELLERNLRYVQQQHELTLADLHNEISRLQEENRSRLTRADREVHRRAHCSSLQIYISI